MGAQAQKPPKHGGHVRSHDTPVGMRLVDDDQPQPAQVRGPHLVAGQQGMVQQVRVGDHVVGVLADPRSLLARGVAVVGGGAQPGQAEPVE